ncbi:hypothetical protein VNO77_07482 [Canavalia gladiata]|uniref:Uncharacterized protein n=1 Tax=Canavalia gladiata TaxID=3824 RepID=A0AAN9M972_CANGL
MVVAKATVIIITITTCDEVQRQSVQAWKYCEPTRIICRWFALSQRHIKPKKKNGTPTAKQYCPSYSTFSQLLWVIYKATADKFMDMEPTEIFINSEEQGPSGMRVSQILRPTLQLMMSYPDGCEQFVDGSLEQTWFHLNQCIGQGQTLHWGQRHY